MLALCRRLMPDHAEDLLHDTLALVWRHADQYDARLGSARAWIYSVLRHVFLTRRAQLGPTAEAKPPMLPPPGLVHGDIGRLAAVSGRQAYEAVAYAYLHGADYPQIARWQQRSEDDVRAGTRASLKELPA